MSNQTVSGSQVESQQSQASPVQSTSGAPSQGYPSYQSMSQTAAQQRAPSYPDNYAQYQYSGMPSQQTGQHSQYSNYQANPYVYYQQQAAAQAQNPAAASAQASSAANAASNQQAPGQDYGYARYGYVVNYPMYTGNPSQPGGGGGASAATGASALMSQPAATSSYPGTTVGEVQPTGLRPKITTTMWEDEKTLCYQVDANGVSVVRRADNNMINGTKLLNVAKMTRGRRDGILKSEKIRHVVKIGSMHLKGVWIPFDRALSMAQREGIVDLLYPLFVKDIDRVIQQGTPTHTGSGSPALNGASTAPTSTSAAAPQMNQYLSSNSMLMGSQGLKDGRNPAATPQQPSQATGSDASNAYSSSYYQQPYYNFYGLPQQYQGYPSYQSGAAVGQPAAASSEQSAPK